MPSRCKPTLLTLPPELRNQIWVYTVLHTQTNGTICPLQDTHGLILAGAGTTKDPYQHSDSYILLPNTSIRLKISSEKPHFPYPHLIPEHQFSNPASIEAIDELYCLWSGSTMAKNRHFCTLDCLTQPALTRVNRQIRAESLGFFYTANHFHLELDNFALAPPTHQVSAEARERVWKQRTPIDWWNSLTPINLGNIQHLSIAAQSFFAYEHNALILDLDFGAKKARRVQTNGARKRHIFSGPQEMERLKDVVVDKEATLRRLLDLIMEQGLSAELLDEVARLLERWDRPFFRSASELERWVSFEDGM